MHAASAAARGCFDEDGVADACGDGAGLFGGGGAAMIAAAARLLGGGAGLTPVLPLAWIDLAPLLACPLVAAAIAALAARATAMALLKEMG